MLMARQLQKRLTELSIVMNTHGCSCGEPANREPWLTVRM